jgi:hypothetical protein
MEISERRLAHLEATLGDSAFQAAPMFGGDIEDEDELESDNEEKEEAPLGDESEAETSTGQKPTGSAKPKTKSASGTSTASGRREGTKPSTRSPKGSSQATKSKSKPSAQGRAISYISSGSEPEVDVFDDESPENRELGDRAEEIVAESERQQGRKVQMLGGNHPGYDITSYVGTKDIRHIEVKGLRGEWGTLGVSLSAKQYESARELREFYWLYVVENVDGPSQAIHRIQDPATKTTHYRVDYGWKNYTEET